MFQNNCNNFVSQKPRSYELVKQRSCALLEGLEAEQKLLLGFFRGLLQKHLDTWQLLGYKI